LGEKSHYAEVDLGFILGRWHVFSESSFGIGVVSEVELACDSFFGEQTEVGSQLGFTCQEWQWITSFPRFRRASDVWAAWDAVYKSFWIAETHPEYGLVTE
jgi:hypothetical protein